MHNRRANIDGERPVISIAPMMGYSDRHFRFVMRQVTRHTLLYTEMVTSGAILNGDRHYLLGFSEEEKPLALQVGGDDPEELSECARIAEDFGYDEINLNVGCPSPRVQKGNFGACLMADPGRIARCVEAMQRASSLTVTAKHRIGVDHLNSYPDLRNFVNIVSRAGCTRFTVHARIALLKGLSPKENRSIPPLRYQDVYQLKDDFPGLWIEINGGIDNLELAREHLSHVDAVMIGRSAVHHPYLFARADALFFGDETEPPSRREIVERLIPYIEFWKSKGTPPYRILRHLLNFFRFEGGAKAWKRFLSENRFTNYDAKDLLEKAMGQVPADTLDQRPVAADVIGGETETPACQVAF